MPTSTAIEKHLYSYVYNGSLIKESYMYQCPKSECKSTDTYKEKIMGNDTGDRICKKCGYTTSANSFRKENTEEKEL